MRLEQLQRTCATLGLLCRRVRSSIARRRITAAFVLGRQSIDGQRAGGGADIELAGCRERAA
jgi:hypothetical protein